MTIGCNIWMICLKLNWFFYGLQFCQSVWTPCYSVWDVFNNFLLIDATDSSTINSNQKRFFIALCLYPLSFFANTPFKLLLIKLPTFQNCILFKFAFIKQYNIFILKNNELRFNTFVFGPFFIFSWGSRFSKYIQFKQVKLLNLLKKKI